jgi:hypothetical protein
LKEFSSFATENGLKLSEYFKTLASNIRVENLKDPQQASDYTEMALFNCINEIEYKSYS